MVKKIIYTAFAVSIIVFLMSVCAFADNEVMKLLDDVPNTEIYNEPDNPEDEAELMGLNTVKTYSKSAQGDTYLSKNFRVREFACKDGSDTILIDSELVTVLQNIRDHFNVTVTITSAYRTAEYNATISGASKNSNHVKGIAADIVVSGVTPAEVAKYAEDIGVRGVGKYSGFVHVDTRTTKYYWINSGGTSTTVSTHGGTFNKYPYDSSSPETYKHSYYRGIEAVHPHREYMMCSCGDYYYTGSNGYYTTYEGAHSHREYYVCEVETCEYNRTYTGNYGTTKKKESTYPYKEYYVCLVSCSYDGTYTGENAIPGKPVLKKSGSSYYVDDNITLSWNTTKNTTHYNIYFDVLENGQYVRTKTKHYVESGMTVTFEQGEYRALVQATNSNYWTEDGSTWLYTDSEWVYFTVYSKPCAPTGVNVSTAGSKVTVSWNSSTNATSYDVYLVQSPWTWADIKYSQNVSGTSYTFINVANGDYKAFVIARPNKDDVQSNWVSLTVNSKKPDAPVIKHSLSNNYGRSGESVTVSWDAISNADSYTYYLTEYPEGYAYTTNTAYGTIAENKIKFTNMSPGKYSVFVHANNSVGRSPQSNWISFYIYEKEYKPVATEMYNGHIYAIYDYEMSWSFAKELCEDMGGHLATITSKEENDFVVNLINYGSKDAYWLGATDFENSTESYCWITGEDFEYANWDEGEPSNTGTSGTKEHFAEIRKSYSYKWNDVNNINKTDKGFILEIEPNAQSITYVDTFNNSRYLVIDRNTAWTEAQKYCEFLGGYLVAINSEEEKNYINSIILEGTREWYYLGGIKKGETWKWVDGSELEHFDWADNAASWSGEYLMKYKNKEGCIALTNTYYPAKHIHNIGFICEIELPYSSSIVEKRNNTYTVTTTCHRVKQGKNIIVIGYDDSGKFVDTKVTQYTSDLVTTELTGDIDKIKIMIWNDLSTLKPLCEAEIIPESEFVIK